VVIAIIALVFGPLLLRVRSNRRAGDLPPPPE